VPTPDLSLAGEFYMLSLDPGQGGLRPHHRRRFRRALLAAAREGGAGHGPGGARRARRKVLDELERSEVIEPRRPFGTVQLLDRKRAGKSMAQLRSRVADGDLTNPRDQQLLLLLAASGVLAGVLTRDERRIAQRRLRKLRDSYRKNADAIHLDKKERLPTANESTRGVPADILALGAVAYAVERDMLTDAIIDSFDGGAFQLDYGLSSVGGGDGGGGGDGSGGGI
jgi:hypothetical protein